MRAAPSGQGLSMSWLGAIFLGLLTGVLAMIYAGLVADLALPWLHISSFEGGSGYFVIFMAFLGLIGGTVIGIVTCRLVGGTLVGGNGGLRGFGASVLLAGGVISGLGAWAWTQRDVAPLVGGQRVDLALELRLPAGAAPPADEPGFVLLTSGARRGFSGGLWQPKDARLEDGRWIVPGRVAITTSEGERRLSLGGPVAAGQTVPIAVPARPAAHDAGFSAWSAPEGEAPGWELRYRVVPHQPPAPPPPPPPSAAQRRQAAFAALPPEAPTETLLGFVNAIWRDEVYDQALRAARQRPDFVPVLAERIRTGAPDVARDGLYLVGALQPVPADIVQAVRARAAGVVGIIEAIDPTAADSRAQVAAAAETLTIGLVVAAYGLRPDGVDLRAELRAIAAASRPREQAPPHPVADSAAGAAARLDQPSRP